MISLFPSVDLDLAGFDTPAFPLDFNPELLLNDESTADDFHNWLQSELDILQDSPKAATDDEATEQPSAPTSDSSGAFGSTGQQQTGSSGMQAAPGIVELFQLHALAPGPNALQQAPWMEQQLFMQPNQQQPVMPQHPQLALQHQQPLEQQQGTQAFAAATAGMQLAMPQQVQLQQQDPGTDMLYQPQPYAMQGQQYLQQLQPGLQQQYMYMPQPGLQQQQQQPGSFAAAATAPQGMMLQSMQQMMMQPMQPYPQPMMHDGSFAGMVLPAAWTAGMPGAVAGPAAAAAAAPAGSGGYVMQPSTGFLQVLSPGMQQMHSGQLMSPTGSSYQAAPAAADAAGQQQQQPHSRGGSAQKARSKANGAAAAAGAATAAAAGGAEKPKAPSRRFRERQKETISSLEAEVIEKLAQLQALSAENEMLKLRSAVLEATVKGREYHMKIIKEHGPPVFDASESAHDVLAAAMQQQQRPCSTTTNYSGASQSGASGSAPTATTHSSQSDTDDEDAPDGEAVAACGGISKSHSGVSHSSTATGAAAAGAAASAAAAEGLPRSATPAAVEVKQEPVDQEAAAAAAAAGKSEDEEEDCGGLPCCDAPQNCTPAQQKKTISTLKHMSTDEIIRHWKQFVHDVTGELLAAEQEQQQQQVARACHSHGSEATAAFAAAFDSSEPGSATTSAAASVGKTCRWCSCSEDHSAEACAEQQRQQQQQRDGMPARITSGCGKDPEVQESGGANPSASAVRILALVSRYSYMSKFVALLNPGVLYHLFGRHLDTGLPAPYSDDHWRQVVSRLGLSKHQVTVILACAELYFSSMSTLLEQRRGLQQQLKQADEGLSECQRRLLGVDGGLNQLQVLDALASNLKREHVLRIMLNCFVWGRSLNSIQFAKSAVYSYPFFPDVHAMVCVLYEDARAMAPNGQPALVFPHRQSSNTPTNHEQQQPQLQALHERLRQESDSLRAEAEAQQQQQQQQQQQSDAQGMQYTGSMQSAGLGELDLEAVLSA